MEKIILKNKPLLEAIFELRWELQEPAQGIKIDPHYKILIGRIYDRLQNKYPFHEQLLTANLPDEFVGYVVQHRFRESQDGWPLVQIGPGIITLNDTEKYESDDFEKRISHLINVLFETYPGGGNNLKFKWLLLRYIDTVDFDYKSDNIFNFLKEKMKLNIELYKNLFKTTGVGNLPMGFDLRFSFPATKPKGALHLRFIRGKRKDKDVDGLIWETQVQSTGDDVPKDKEKINGWVVNAHQLTHDWFFEMIKGELLRRFK